MFRMLFFFFLAEKHQVDLYQGKLPQSNCGTKLGDERTGQGAKPNSSPNTYLRPGVLIVVGCPASVPRGMWGDTQYLPGGSPEQERREEHTGLRRLRVSKWIGGGGICWCNAESRHELSAARKPWLRDSAGDTQQGWGGGCVRII